MKSTGQLTRETQISPRQKRAAEIASTAASLFAASGVATVSMDDIAKSVGVAKATLYHYFSTKDEILYAIHEEMFMILLEKSEARKSAGLPATERLFGYVQDAFELVDSHPGYARVVFEHLRQLSPPYKRKVRDNQIRYEQAVADILESGIAEGVFARVNVRIATLALFGMVNWSHQWYSPKGQYSPSELSEQFFEIYLNGIAKPQSSR
jgi:AcrR family transcriptional regulator